MTTRRISVTCNHREIVNLQKRFNNDLKYEECGDTFFPIEFDVCGKKKQVLDEYEFDEIQKVPVTIPEDSQDPRPYDEADGHDEAIGYYNNIKRTWIVQKLACGHEDIVLKDIHEANKSRNLLWDNLLPHQQDFISFAEAAPRMRVINRDEMGTGKTPITISIIRENLEKFTCNGTKFCIICVLPGAVYQWEEEIQFWMGLNNPTSLLHLQMQPQVVVTNGQFITPMSKLIVIPWSRLGDKKVLAQIAKIGVGSICVDECHYYKALKSKRTQALMEYAKLAGPDAPMVFLSGTLVENRVMEMEIPLNLCDPVFFHSKYVLDNFCMHDERGKATVLSPWHKDKFFQRTGKYMLGRKKADLNLPLPPFDNSNVIWMNPADHEVNEEFASMYNKTLDEMQHLLESPATNSATIIGLMQQLRHWSGKMKILGAAIWIDTWMTEHPGEKLAVGIHHIAVRQSLATLLAHRKPLQMSDEDAKEKDEIERGFRNGKSNLLICNIMSAGVGRNMQFCKNALILERQWNKSKENQFEQRFHRIIKDAEGRVKTDFTEEDTVRIYYMNGQNTFDEYFDPLIHLKGIIVESTEDGDEDMPDVDFIMGLARKVVANRIKWVNI